MRREERGGRLKGRDRGGGGRELDWSAPQHTLAMSSMAVGDLVPIMTSPMARPAASPITASSLVIKFSFRRSYTSDVGVRGTGIRNRHDKGMVMERKGNEREERKGTSVGTDTGNR
jgi:hypothetical protein